MSYFNEIYNDPELIRQGRVEKQARFRESGGITSNCYRIKVGQAELTDELSRT